MNTRWTNSKSMKLMFGCWLLFILGSLLGSPSAEAQCYPEQLYKLLADDGAESDIFGVSVAISGSTAIVGADHDDDNGENSGSAYLFDTTTGQQVQKLLPEDGDADDRFGVSVAINGTTAIVGAPRDDDNGSASGSAYLFDTTTGQQLHKLLANDGAAIDQFGMSVSISGTTVIVGAFADDDNGDNAGSAYLFDVSECNILLGDVNRDGKINLLDVQPFVDLLVSSGYQAEADIKQDGVVNLLDVQPFVNLLAG